ncbi:MAG: heparin lyase I family protein [Chitinophagaceae bacterium]|nr:heparin lyase I family protein [Chitinophagaceae bacterium]
MKNRTQNGIVILCLLLTATFMSCQKEAPPVEPLTTVTSDIEDYPGQENMIELPDAPSNEGIDPLAMTSSTFGTRKNLFFNFTTEATNALTSFYGGSTTQWKYRGGWSAKSIQRSSAFARSGGYSARYELNKTDGDVGGSKRAETNRASSDEPVIKMERWYGASYFLPNEYVSDKAPEVVLQWHTDKGSPHLLCGQ